MAINYNYETEFKLSSEDDYSDWIYRVLKSEAFQLEELSFIFCDDEYLLKLNQKYLRHNTFTDIITFDYSRDGLLSGDIFISVERVNQNALDFNVTREEEMQRVMVHGVLHLMGYKDKTDKENLVMRQKENEKIRLFHVEH